MLLSLCMATNGVSEWVFPSLNSIYAQDVNNNLFEVIVTDNGNNYDFEKEMLNYAKKHKNLMYKKTDAYMFDNQIEALKLGKGTFLKVLNHRDLWQNGMLQYMVNFLLRYEEEKPVIYFSNGALKKKEIFNEYKNFDDFVYNLGIYGTWSTGVGIFKTNFDRMKDNLKYNKFFPHTGILYGDTNNAKYIINDKVCIKEIEENHSKKGKYDLYKAFALDGFSIIVSLYREGKISENTVIETKQRFREFLISLYRDFNLNQKPCSYDLNGFEKYVNIFFDEKDIVLEAKKGLKL